MDYGDNNHHVGYYNFSNTIRRLEIEDKVRIGVYICHCGLNIAGKVDVEQVAEYAATLGSVVVARDYKYMCSDPGQALIKDGIKDYGLNRVVVASCTPRMHELTFRNACRDAGLNPYLYEHANIREHCSWVHDDRKIATEKAKDIVRAAVRRVYYHEPLEVKEAPVNPDVLVVGGGIAGMQASLDIANGELKVYLVEREASIGGHMSQLDRTFPTLDCSECIMTPKMTEVGQHPYIELMSYSEVVEVSGYIGNFKVKVRKKARYVDASKCTGCDVCEEKCPVRVPSEFEVGMGERGAVYIPFAQAIPNVPVIDRRGYPPCRVACPAGVNAQGYIALISQGKFGEALEVLRRTMPFAGVCGRVCTHPCEVDCERGKVDEPVSIRSLKRFMADYELRVGREKATPIEKTKEDKVAIIGSGPAGLACAYDLVRQGYPVTVFDAAPQSGGLLRYGIPEYRLPNEVVENEIDYIEELGVEIKTNTPVKDLEDIFNQGYRAIFLATGAQASQKIGVPGEDSKGVISALDFLKQVNSGVKVSLGKRVLVIGGGSVAIDAARVSLRLGAKEVHLICLESRDLTSKDRMLAQDMEIQEAEEERLIIHPSLGVRRILNKDGRVTGLETIVCVSVRDENGRFVPKFKEGTAQTVEGDYIITAIGQTPDVTAFSEVEKTQVRTIKVDGITLQTNIDGVFAGGDVVSGPSDVIATVAAGKEAAISIDRYLSRVDLKEGRPEAIQRVKEISTEGVKPRARAAMAVLELEKRRGFTEVALGFDEKTAIEEAKRCLNCGVCSDCLECVKFCDPKAIDFEQTDQIVEFEVGSIIMATGYDIFDPSVIPQYGYKKFDNVFTGIEFERMTCAGGPTGGKVLLKDGREPESVAIVHCVGSRDQNYHEYCSRVCCMYGLKYAHLIKELTNAEVYEMYIDMRCFGEGYEEFYKRLSEEGVSFIRGKVAKVTDRAVTEEEKGKLVVVCEDTLLGRMIRVPVDMVILCTALEARSDTEQVAKIFTLNRRADGFFLERHVKLDPVATPTDGVFIAGCCESPKDIPDTVAQASAAAAKVLSLISKGRITLEAAVANVDENRCQGCGRCEEICDFHAPAVISKNGVWVSAINETLCKGCGACAVICPTGAMSVRHFTQEQILSMVDAFAEV